MPREDAIAHHRNLLAQYPWPFPAKVETVIAEYVPPAPVDMSGIPPLQQIAMIAMTESHVMRTLVKRMREQAGAKETWTDYRVLVQRGFAERRKRDGYHFLAPEGRPVAAHLVRLKCIELDVHLLDETSHDRWQSFYRCPCGFSGSVRRSTTSTGNINHAHAAHVRFEQRKMIECATISDVG